MLQAYQIILLKQNLKPQNLLEVLNSMVKYKVNLKFKEDGKSLNETITEVLKIELNKIINNEKIQIYNTRC